MRRYWPDRPPLLVDQTSIDQPVELETVGSPFGHGGRRESVLFGHGVGSCVPWGR